ncbi:MAG: hypothetical protein BWY37_00320 [Firmicutes bacterium ADurb.Bin262]|nr:MAG: hypothetical protein BWY37_00320 [Firmicutes bacterium ADurb.Bin262]
MEALGNTCRGVDEDIVELRLQKGDEPPECLISEGAVQRQGRRQQRADAVANQRGARLAAAQEHIAPVESHRILQPQDNIQAPQADIGVDGKNFEPFCRKSPVKSRSRCRFAHAALARSNHDFFSHRRPPCLNRAVRLRPAVRIDRTGPKTNSQKSPRPPERWLCRCRSPRRRRKPRFAVCHTARNR